MKKDNIKKDYLKMRNDFLIKYIWYNIITEPYFFRQSRRIRVKSRTSHIVDNRNNSIGVQQYGAPPQLFSKCSWLSWYCISNSLDWKNRYRMATKNHGSDTTRLFFNYLKKAKYTKLGLRLWLEWKFRVYSLFVLFLSIITKLKGFSIISTSLLTRSHYIVSVNGQ